MKSQWPNAILVHTPIHASWLNQIEIYFSIVQRKVLTPNDFSSLIELEQRLLALQSHYEKTASPFQWTLTTYPGTFQASFQIAPYGRNHLFVVVQKIADALQQWFQRDALLQQLPIGETDLWSCSSGHLQSSVFFEAWSLSRFRAWRFRDAA